MKITDHMLVAEAGDKIKINLSPFAGPVIAPKFMIMHYTVTDGASSAVNWFKDTKNNTSKLAAHIVLDRDGTIIQMIPFNKKCSHAGSSNWNGVDGMNSVAIGIEIVNPGQVSAQFPQKASAVIKASHKNSPLGAAPGTWFAYPQAQLDALYKLSKLILATYPAIKSVLGHDDVSPIRKADPGPAFSWDAFNTAVFGAPSNVGKIFTVNTPDTKFRNTNSTVNNTPLKVLPVGYQVGLIEELGDWCKVFLANGKSDVIVPGSDPAKCYKTIGWIHKTLLTVKPGQH